MKPERFRGSSGPGIETVDVRCAWLRYNAVEFWFNLDRVLSLCASNLLSSDDLGNALTVLSWASSLCVYQGIERS